jgi:hypothetical protein
VVALTTVIALQNCAMCCFYPVYWSDLVIIRLSAFELDEIFVKFICCFFADLRVLNKYHSVHSFSAFSNVYDNSGLFGIYLTTVS